MFNKLFKSVFAVAMVLGAAVGFVSCQPEEEKVENPTVQVSAEQLNFTNEEGSQTINVTSNANWKTENAAEWVTVTPTAGQGNKTLTVSVSMNDTGAVRTAEVKVIALHPEWGAYETVKFVVSQSADENATVDEELLYSDDFNGKEATKTYGNSGNSWPYIDQFPEFANPEGPAAANVNYTGQSVSVRANSTSNSSYSDYPGSGSNNIFFGGGGIFYINDIAPLKADQKSYKLTFGSEKYTQDGDSTFRPEEFLVSISKDGEKWAPVEYTYAGVEPGRWNVATANFTLATVPESLYIKFEATVASVYRLDDVKFFVGNGGQTIDLDNIQIVEPEPPTTDALYYDNFDGKTAAKNSDGYWPYVDEFPEMKNAAGPAAEGVNYTGYNATVRSNSNSDGSYSDYEGSGKNNIFFGKDNAWFAINELSLEASQKNLVLTFGTEKYSQESGSLFKPAEFLVSLSEDGEKWTNVEYTFAGTAEGRWNVATANFTLAEVPAKLYIKFTATAASAYRLDDVTLDLGEGGQLINLANGTTPEPEPEPGEVVKATVREFLDAAEGNTIYELTGEITSVANTTYGNFYLKDDTGEVYIYGLCSPEGEKQYWAESGVKVGDIITIQTVRTSYQGTPQGKDAIYVSHVSVEVEKPEIPEGCVEASIVFVNAGYENAESVDGTSIALDNNVSVVFSKGGAGTAPAYYTSGEAIRMYQNGATLDVTANGKSIKSIELTFSNNHYYLAANCGELSEEAPVRTWTGDATAVKFTSTGTDKDHRAYVSAIKVIYAE